MNHFINTASDTHPKFLFNWSILCFILPQFRRGKNAFLSMRLFVGKIADSAVLQMKTLQVFTHWVVCCLVGFNVWLDIHNGLLPTVWDSSLRMIRRHAVTILIRHRGDSFLAFYPLRGIISDLFGME